MAGQIPAAEAFRALRTRIRYSKKKTPKTILVTSSLPGEGKSFIAANIAGTFALSGKRTLLVDCDLRKPTVHSIMGAERVPGLSDVLQHRVSIDDAIRHSSIENFDFITAGTIPKNPSELVGSEQMNFTLKELEGLYEVIIIDCPAFLSATDAEILFNMVNVAVVVARAGKTPKAAFQKVYDRLREINPNSLLGCLLNDFSVQKTFGRYYYGNYSYDYTYEGSGNGKLH
jgi:capsular exopolysaccharide synthesis family protein